MGKLPAFLFYPADWRKDLGVQSLGFYERGIWIEILCLLHESEQRGKLMLNGQPMSDDVLARLLGLDKQILTKALTSLLTSGVASRDEETGALVNRRMIRDEEIRKARAKCGKMGGNPRLLKQKSTPQVNQNPTTGVNQIPTPSVTVTVSRDIDIDARGISPSIEEVQAVAARAGLPPDQAEAFFHHFEAQGWVTGTGQPIMNWQSKLAGWRNEWQAKIAGGRRGGGPFANPKIEALKAKIANHPANKDSLKFNSNRTEAEWEELQTLKAELQSLTCAP